MKISVCMATFNSEKYLELQINSILSQLGKNDELIISDNGSSDRTIEIIKSYKDNRIKLSIFREIRSPIFNFENALKNASGDYIFLADHDDIWYYSKIKEVKKILYKHDLVVHDAHIIDKNGNIIGESLFKVLSSGKGLKKNLLKNSYVGCTMAFNRYILDKSIPFPRDIPMHDWWIGVIAEIYGKVFFLNQQLIGYRRHDNNFSFTLKNSRYSLIKKTMFRYNIVKNLFLRVLK